MAISGNKRVVSALALIVGFYAIIVDPIYAQNASVHVNSNGDLVFTSIIDFAEIIPPEMEDDEPFDFTPSGDFSWLYYDVRNTNYINNYDQHSAGLVSDFNNNPYSITGDVKNLRYLYYLGEYHFGDTSVYVGSCPSSPCDQPDFTTDGSNTYYAGRYATVIGPSGATDEEGELTMTIVLGFDAPASPASMQPLDFDVEHETLGTLPSGHALHSLEFGYQDGSWLSGSPSCGDEWYDCGFITGSYEFVTYIDSHPGAGPDVISAFQETLAVVRFTVVDSGDGEIPGSSISDKRTVVAESDMETPESGFTLSSGSDVNFVIPPGGTLIFGNSFSTASGATFRTSVGGGTPVSKKSSTPSFEVVSPGSVLMVEPDQMTITAYPNPGLSTEIYLETRTQSEETLYI
ncbi:MAG: hypothetical protein ACO390_17440, partial [bacterium]